MSITSLSGQYISASFSALTQYSSSGNLYDGNGNQIITLNVTASNSAGSSATGANGQIQYYNNGAFAANSRLVYIEASSSLQLNNVGNVASGQSSIAAGTGTHASGSSQTVIGQYNVGNTSSLFIVGNGTAVNSRSNAFEVTPSGSVLLSPQQSALADAEPTYTGRNGELAITYSGSATYLYVFVDTIGWKGINLTT
jgi:hypothetical protein